MWHPIRRIARDVRPARAVVVAALAIAVAPACGERDTVPTAPRLPDAASAAIVGADVSTVGFDVAAINEAGQVAGTAGGRAVLWTPGEAPLDLGTLGGASSRAYAINKAGHVAGSSTTATGATHAFRWTPEQGMVDLGTLPEGTASIARGINDFGHVVGEVTLPPCPACDQPEKHAFLSVPGQEMQDLGILKPGLSSTVAYDINNAGQVVGRAFAGNARVFPPTDPEYLSRAFLWAPGEGMRDIGDLGGGHSIAYAINDAGQVVGRSWLSTGIEGYGLPYRAFVWTSDEGMRSLGTLTPGPSASAAYGINEAGQVVGTTDTGPYFLGSGPLQAFLWTAENGMDAITPTTGIRTPRGINGDQHVIGDGRVATVHLTLGNTPPVAKPGGPYAGVEGSWISLAMSADDIDDVAFVFHVAFGDGSEDYFYPTPLPWRHTYADDGTYTLTVTAIDNRGARDTKTTTATVANVPPAILPGSLTGPTAPIPMTGGSASAPLALEFRDPAGQNDTYTVEIACGNSVVVTSTNVPVSNTYLTDGTYTGKGVWTGSCTYTAPGVYTVRATVSDEDGGTSAPAFHRDVVVYDPAGGSVAGNGFYAVADHRKAHFSFTAGFAAGSPSAPNGTARLWIPGERLELVSATIEMLVVAGDWAQFWGTGTLNGAPARFRITAVDAQRRRDRAADAFRIEIWQADALVFDTQPGAARDAPLTTTLDGGNIQIQRP